MIETLKRKWLGQAVFIFVIVSVFRYVVTMDIFNAPRVSHESHANAPDLYHILALPVDDPKRVYYASVMYIHIFCLSERNSTTGLCVPPLKSICFVFSLGES